LQTTPEPVDSRQPLKRDLVSVTLRIEQHLCSTWETVLMTSAHTLKQVNPRSTVHPFFKPLNQNLLLSMFYKKMSEKKKGRI
jgi:hypothetical protein